MISEVFDWKAPGENGTWIKMEEISKVSVEQNQKEKHGKVWINLCKNKATNSKTPAVRCLLALGGDREFD